MRILTVLETPQIELRSFTNFATYLVYNIIFQNHNFPQTLYRNFATYTDLRKPQWDSGHKKKRKGQGKGQGKGKLSGSLRH